MKHIAIITATRAEYGLLAPLIRQLSKTPGVTPHLLVSGTHLLQHYGYTKQQIEADGFPIEHVIPILDEDHVGTERQATRAAARAADQMAAIFETNHYDAMIVLGDRYELLGFCTAAVICRVPIIHIHGGEITEGAIDDKIRHAITKMASLHFPSIEPYAKRILQMGESPERVFPVGALGIDNILQITTLDKPQLLQLLGISDALPLAAVTFHPVTVESPEMAAQEVQEVLQALLETGVYAVITCPNSDVGGMQVYTQIARAVEAHPEQMCLHKSLGQKRYLSLLRHADIMVGNSSSGILESAAFGLPTVDIGERQKGRLRPKNVVHCGCTRTEIVDAIRRGLDPAFREGLRGYVTPYGDGHAAERIARIIQETDFSDPSLIAKPFCDR